MFSLDYRFSSTIVYLIKIKNLKITDMGFFGDLGTSVGMNVATGAVNAAQGAGTAYLLGGKEGFKSWRNSLTQQGLTGEQLELQKLQDSQYQRAVKDMQLSGLNPAMMFSGRGSGEGVVSQSSNQSLLPSSDMLDGMNRIQERRASIASQHLVEKQEMRQDIENAYANEKEIQELQGLIKDNEKKGIDNSEAKKRLEILEATQDELIKRVSLENTKIAADIRERRASAKNIEIRNKYQDLISQWEATEGEDKHKIAEKTITLLTEQAKTEETKQALNAYEIIYKASDLTIRSNLSAAQMDMMYAQEQLANNQSDESRQRYEQSAQKFESELTVAVEKAKQEGIMTENLPKNMRNERTNRTVQTIAHSVATVGAAIIGASKLGRKGSVSEVTSTTTKGKGGSTTHTVTKTSSSGGYTTNY